MSRSLVHDPMFLGIPSKPASADDAPLARELLDTLIENRSTCVGMAANMIGVSKRIIAFFDGAIPVVMYNPEIIARSLPYDTEEGCLSLLGDPRKTVRYEKIKVRFRDVRFCQQTKSYSGFTAQIIQHEVDHCNGILI